FAIEKRIERVAVSERPRGDKKLGARFNESDFRGDEVAVTRDLAKSYGGKQLFGDVSVLVTAGQRIAIVGDNGAGKSTLVKIIMGEERPDAGFARLGPAVKAAYLPQSVKFDDPYMSALDTLMYETGCSAASARNRLGSFKFSGEDVFKLVGDMSGGEQSRLRLCSLMSADVNLLVLDEPTNHLDAASREWMEDALGGYGGALLFVSHDRYFIDKFATRVWELRDGAFTDFDGTFEEYMLLRNERRAPPPRRTKRPAMQKKPPRTDAASLKKRADRAERDIGGTEAALAELALEKEQYATDYIKLMELETKESELRAQLDAQYALWAELTN
ncbi:MAG: ATP-binding cassette domain-containing protein, partial [Oscillospiraceae bacterium]|nr:ATP-binding cassette domain-containing protein [Oscillospiraceae bacterium]